MTAEQLSVTTNEYVLLVASLGEVVIQPLMSASEKCDNGGREPLDDFQYITLILCFVFYSHMSLG